MQVLLSEFTTRRNHVYARDVPKFLLESLHVSYRGTGKRRRSLARSRQKVQRARGQHPRARCDLSLWIRFLSDARARDAYVGSGRGKDGLEATKRNRDERHGGGTCDEYIKNEKVGTKGGEMAANEGE